MLYRHAIYRLLVCAYWTEYKKDYLVTVKLKFRKKWNCKNLEMLDHEIE